MAAFCSKVHHQNRSVDATVKLIHILHVIKKRFPCWLLQNVLAWKLFGTHCYSSTKMSNSTNVGGYASVSQCLASVNVREACVRYVYIKLIFACPTAHFISEWTVQSSKPSLSFSWKYLSNWHSLLSFSSPLALLAQNKT